MSAPRTFTLKFLNLPHIVINKIVPEPQLNANAVVWNKYYEDRDAAIKDITENHTLITPSTLSLEDLELKENEWGVFDDTYFRSALLKTRVIVNIAGYSGSYDIGETVYLEFKENEPTGVLYLYQPNNLNVRMGGKRSKTRRSCGKNRRSRKNRRNRRQ